MILQEVQVLQSLIEMFDQGSSADGTVVFLNNVQCLCAQWWDISRELYNLHMLYAGDPEVSQISGLIGRS